MSAMQDRRPHTYHDLFEQTQMPKTRNPETKKNVSVSDSERSVGVEGLCRLTVGLLLMRGRNKLSGAPTWPLDVRLCSCRHVPLGCECLGLVNINTLNIIFLVVLSIMRRIYFFLITESKIIEYNIQTKISLNFRNRIQHPSLTCRYRVYIHSGSLVPMGSKINNPVR